MSYAKPTTSTTLYEFTNREQDLIRQAFNSKNFTFISKLPYSISPTRVSESYKLASLNNSTRRHSSVEKRQSDFAWMPDEFDLAKKQVVNDSILSKQKQQQISPANFKNPGASKKLKYEDLSGNSFTYTEDHFDNPLSHSTRVKWLKQLKFIQKEFKSPSKNDYYISKIKSKEILSSLKSTISNDWPELEFSINYSELGIIEIKFQALQSFNKKSLHLYMNQLHARQEFVLRKDLSQWGAEMSETVYYNFIPPWVHLRNDIHSCLFPHGSNISVTKTGKNMPGSGRSTLFNSNS